MRLCALPNVANKNVPPWFFLEPLTRTKIKAQRIHQDALGFFLALSHPEILCVEQRSVLDCKMHVLRKRRRGNQLKKPKHRKGSRNANLQIRIRQIANGMEQAAPNSPVFVLKNKKIVKLDRAKYDRLVDDADESI